MASNDYDRPVPNSPLEPDSPARTINTRGTWTGPLGMALAILFVILMLMAFLG
jgi:hypothetical protein